MTHQSTPSILMIRPSGFGPNAETASDNEFQTPVEVENDRVETEALCEFDGMVQGLREAGVGVYVWNEPPDSPFPDALFPNNWLSTDREGQVFLYPMKPESRRGECRPEVLSFLIEQGFVLKSVYDLRSFQTEKYFLEGTGSLVLDHVQRIAFAAISERTSAELTASWCENNGYRPVIFHTRMPVSGMPVYHTNVIMSIGTTWAVVCPDTISSADERAAVMNALSASGRMILPITITQVAQFCGNILEVRNAENDCLIILSSTAYNGFTPDDRARLAHHTRLLPVDIGTIEKTGGGSARCMIAELFLPR